MEFCRISSFYIISFNLSRGNDQNVESASVRKICEMKEKDKYMFKKRKYFFRFLKLNVLQNVSSFDESRGWISKREGEVTEARRGEEVEMAGRQNLIVKNLFNDLIVMKIENFLDAA